MQASLEYTYNAAMLAFYRTLVFTEGYDSFLCQATRKAHPGIHNQAYSPSERQKLSADVCQRFTASILPETQTSLIASATIADSGI